MAIICDTMIWYGLANGSIEKPSGQQLVGTYLSLHELATTHIIRKDIAKIQSVITTAVNESAYLRLSSPKGYINYLQGWSTEDNDGDIILELIEKIRLSGEIPESYLSRIEEFKAGIANDTDEYNEQIDSYRSAYSEQQSFDLKNKLKRQAGKVEHRKIMINWIEKHFEIPPLNDDECLEIFIGALDQLFQQFQKQKNFQLQPNDWVDLMNLIYVQPGDKYWTLEKRRVSEWIRQAGMDHYFW